MWYSQSARFSDSRQELRDRGVVVDQVLDLINFIDGEGTDSYDYSDWWSTSWGAYLKRLAYTTEPAGHLFFSVPLLICELWLPFLRRPLGIPKRSYPISIAHRGLAQFELYKFTGKVEWLRSAIRDADLLLSLSVPDACGLCWGFPFPWSSNSGIIPPTQPAATQTAYAVDLFEQLATATGQEIYQQRMLQAAGAIDREYVSLPRETGLATTYHGRGYGDVVINAISYQIHILTRAMAHGEKRYRSKVIALTDYVLSQQEKDGSWLYGESEKIGSSITITPVL